MEETPETQPAAFETVRGRRGRRHVRTGEIWEKDRLHEDHWEVYTSRASVTALSGLMDG